MGGGDGVFGDGVGDVGDGVLGDGVGDVCEGVVGDGGVGGVGLAFVGVDGKGVWLVLRCWSGG